jgi:hypothetical protein
MAAIVVALLATGCTETPKQGLASDSLSRRERDSIIAGSKLPGAPVVRRAMQVTDSAAARVERLNTGGR